MSIKLNVNIRTLLNNCEELAKFKVNHVRLQPLVDSLQNMINELQQTDSNCKHIPDYAERLNNLKELIGYTRHLPVKLIEKNSGLNESQSMESSQDMLRQSRQFQSSQIYMDIRKKLIPEVYAFGDGVRHRHAVDTSKVLSSTDAKNIPESMEQLIDSSEKRRNFKNLNCENIADHMLSITQNLREQTEIANRIIRLDTDVVSQSNDAVDDNLHALNRESRKLENHSSFDRNCWVWVMITFVLITFIGTVIFMKMVKKK